MNTQSQNIQPASPPATPFVPPYAASWVNWLTRQIERLPIPLWVFYLALWILLGTITTVLEWLAGTYAVGTVNFFHIVFAAGIPYILGAMHYLNRYASTAMRNFRPVLKTNPLQYQELEYRLTVQPARTTLFWCVVLVAASLNSLFFADTAVEAMQLARTPLALTWGALLVIGWNSLGAAWFYQIYRFMHMVNQIYDEYTQIDLFQQSVLYGFSGLLARASLSVMFAFTTMFLTADWLFTTTVSVASTAFFVLLAATIFLLPLQHIHGRLVTEKQHRLGQVGARIQTGIENLEKQVDADDADNAAQTKDVLTALETAQRLLEKIPTWPWQPETIRLIITALLLPIALFIFQFIIRKLVE